MKISARNVFTGTISALNSGPVSAEVVITTTGSDTLTATITQASVQTLGLAMGKPVSAIIKASHVMVMTDSTGVRLSARNCLAGTVKSVQAGPVSAEVVITLPGGADVFASITRDAVAELGIRVGCAATAVIKASSIILGVSA